MSDWPQPYRLLDAEPYWTACNEERLTFQRCDRCSDAIWPAHSVCPHCSSGALTWEESMGRGVVWSFSTIMRAPTPVFAGIAPYTVGFVRLDEGYHLFTQIEAEPDAVAIDMPVEVRFVPRGEQVLPVFAPRGS
ncbi:OB-fold domain-containing protein [Pseudonocardia sp. C8]|uniref:Zn-ribbon domain-containing OB-fold protein n=1 Tax=Pseudonocardia sp. C8 TaxID=2762759 RepID=UPI001642359B|nr:OB-fold domain-containing protein [Pseudonocardia sp. C8]MBC3191703.1 OB-fold domain-containing protein [Pseudonocardia sp. C8]